MEDSAFQFDYSTEHDKRANRFIFYVVLPMTALFATGFALFVTKGNFREVLLPAIGSWLIVTIILVIERPLIDRHLRKKKIIITEGKIIRLQGRRKYEIPWEHIAKVTIREKPNGAIAGIELRQINKRVRWLSAYSDMDKMAELIKQHMPKTAKLETKRNKIDHHHICLRTIGYCFLMMGAVIVFMCFITWLGRTAIDIFAIVFALGVGSICLIGRPFRRLDVSEKWLDLIAGGSMFLLGIGALITFILTGRVP